MKTTLTLAAATAMISTAYAQFGSMAIINHCPFDLYVWPVAGGEPAGSMITLPGGQPGIGYKETYRETANQGGVSLKISPNYGPGNSVPGDAVTQLEYTVPNRNDPSQKSVWDLIFYDLSWVNGNVFEGIAMTMQTSTGASANPCPFGTCGLGQSCDIGYEWSTDDSKTHACAIDQDIIWTFCSAPGGSLVAPKGLIGKRDAIPEPVAAAKADADADAAPIAVCVQVGGDGLVQECNEPAAPTTAAPVVALQKPVEQPSSTTTPITTTTPAAPTTTPAAPTTTPAAPAPVPTAPVPVAKPPPAGAVIGLSALTNIQDAGVQTWLSWNTAAKRDLFEHSAHRHNHQAFHRRNRIIKSSSA